MTGIHVSTSSIVCLALALAPCPALANSTGSTSVMGMALGLQLGAESAVTATLLAPADDTNARAREAYQEGETAYRLGKFQDAAAAFEQAYELSGLSDILYNIGLAYLRWYDVDVDLAHLRKARVVFQNYIIELQKNPDLGDLEEAESHIAQIDEKIAAHKGVEEPQEDDPPQVEDPPQVVDPGPDPGKKLRLGGGIAMGLGGALVAGGVVSGVVLGLRGQSLEDELNLEFDARDAASCVQGDVRQECMDIEARIVDLQGQGGSANGLAYGLGLSLGGVGLIGVIVGAVLFVKGNKQSKTWKVQQLVVGPQWSPRGGGLTVSGRF